jgi:hypothetical protein
MPRSQYWVTASWGVRGSFLFRRFGLELLLLLALLREDFRIVLLVVVAPPSSLLLVSKTSLPFASAASSASTGGNGGINGGRSGRRDLAVGMTEGRPGIGGGRGAALRKWCSPFISRFDRHCRPHDVIRRRCCLHCALTITTHR